MFQKLPTREECEAERKHEKREEQTQMAVQLFGIIIGGRQIFRYAEFGKYENVIRSKAAYRD